jgi:hypothetical protein
LLEEPRLELSNPTLSVISLRAGSAWPQQAVLQRDYEPEPPWCWEVPEQEGGR